MNTLQNFIKESRNPKENSAVVALLSLKNFENDWYIFPFVNDVIELNEKLIKTFGPMESDDPYCSALDINPEDFENLDAPFSVLVTRQKKLTGMTVFTETIDTSEDDTSYGRNKIYIYLVR